MDVAGEILRKKGTGTGTESSSKEKATRLVVQFGGSVTGTRASEEEKWGK